MINCVIVDDEPLAREGMSNYVKEVDFLNLITTCENLLDLVPLLSQHTIDLLFLDIQLPYMNGLDFLRTLKHPPIVVITTAYSDYALESYKLNVTDYLLKPIEFDQFLKSVQKVKHYHDLVNKSGQDLSKAEPPRDYFFIRSESKYEKIYFRDIVFIEGMQNYVTINTRKNKYITLLTLRTLEENLDKDSFIRVHKSFLVSADKIDSISGKEIIIGTHHIPVGENYRKEVMQRIVESNLWDKVKRI